MIECKTREIMRLRILEVQCYSIVYHLLQNEKEAVQVSLEVLLDLWMKKQVPLSSRPQEEIEVLRKLAIRHSLARLQERAKQKKPSL
jgi:hypothetical protein